MRREAFGGIESVPEEVEPRAAWDGGDVGLRAPVPHVLFLF